MNCPKCGNESDADWPLTVDGENRDGGCQLCWEKECSESWWDEMDTIHGLSDESKKKCQESIA